MALTFDEYQKLALRTAVQGPENFMDLMHWVLGTVGESAEIAEKFKKIIRDDGGKVTDAHIKELSKEIGDVLWYLAVLANHLGLSFDEIASNNIDKLASRQKRGQIHGSGDNR